MTTEWNAEKPTVAQLEAATDLTPYLVGGSGSVRFIETGQSNSPAYVDGVLVDPGTDWTIEEPQRIDWAEIARNLSTTVERARAAMLALGQAMDVSPRAELLFRVNARLRGTDPGEPVNWRGVGGL